MLKNSGGSVEMLALALLIMVVGLYCMTSSLEDTPPPRASLYSEERVLCLKGLGTEVYNISSRWDKPSGSHRYEVMTSNAEYLWMSEEHLKKCL